MANESKSQVSGAGNSKGGLHSPEAKAKRRLRADKMNSLTPAKKFAVKQLQSAINTCDTLINAILEGKDVSADAVESAGKLTASAGSMLFS